MEWKARGFQRLLLLTLAGLAVLAGVAALDAQPAAQPRIGWNEILDQDGPFYATTAAADIAQAVLTYQQPSGGWPKNLDMTRPAPAAAASRAVDEATIDNGATTTQLEFLSRVRQAQPSMASRLDPSIIKGIDYLLAAQYPSGGWPQFYPLRTDYSRHITFNDNAMVNVLQLLQRVATGSAPFDVVDTGRRQRSGAAVERGVEMILASQVRIDGQLTAWCAQHDAVTLEPRPARAYEHASLNGSESVGIIRFLMRRPATPAVVAAVEAGVTWLRKVRLPDGRWARFYEFATNRPIFSGRDGTIRYRLEEIEKERQDGYAWYGTWGKGLLERDYPAWTAKLR